MEPETSADTRLPDDPKVPVAASSRNSLLGFLAQRMKQKENFGGEGTLLATSRAKEIAPSSGSQPTTAPPSMSSDASEPFEELMEPPASLTPQGTAPQQQVSATENIQQSHAPAVSASGARSGLGSWLTKITGAYSVAVRGLGGNFLMRGYKLNDFSETRDRLERTAADLNGQARLVGLRRWTSIMQSLRTLQEQGPMYTTQPLSPGSSEGDWQTFTQVGNETRTTPAEAELAMRVNEMWFIEPGGEPLTFREVFLKSTGLENIIAGYANWPPTDARDRDVLLQLFEVTLMGDAQLHAALVDALLQLSEACRVWREAGGTPAECLGVTRPVADAVASLKCMASVAILDRKMAALKAEIAQQAAIAAQRHKFNQGSEHPSGDASPSRLASGLAATAQIMAQAEQLCRLVEQRQALIEAAPQPDWSGAVAALQDTGAALAAAILDAEAHISTVLQQKRDGQANRGRKVEGMEAALRVVGEEIAGLDTRRNALLSQLAQVEASLAQAHAKRADLEESRNVFEEGVAFSMDALQHQVDELAAAHKRHNAESAALQESRSLVTSLSEHASRQAAKAVEAARASTADIVQEFVYSACRHLYFQRAELQLLLRKLLFCAAELQGLNPKEERATKMGMNAITSDMAKQRWALQSSFLEAESATAGRLAEVEAVRASVENTCRTKLSAASPTEADIEGQHSAGVTTTAQTKEFMELLASIAEVKSQIEGLDRPQGLPPPGQLLPPLEEENKESPSAAGGREEHAAPFHEQTEGNRVPGSHSVPGKAAAGAPPSASDLPAQELEAPSSSDDTQATCPSAEHSSVEALTGMDPVAAPDTAQDEPDMHHPLSSEAGGHSEEGCTAPPTQIYNMSLEVSLDTSSEQITTDKVELPIMRRQDLSKEAMQAQELSESFESVSC